MQPFLNYFTSDVRPPPPFPNPFVRHTRFHPLSPSAYLSIQPVTYRFLLPASPYSSSSLGVVRPIQTSIRSYMPTF